MTACWHCSGQPIPKLNSLLGHFRLQAHALAGTSTPKVHPLYSYTAALISNGIGLTVEQCCSHRKRVCTISRCHLGERHRPKHFHPLATSTHLHAAPTNSCSQVRSLTMSSEGIELTIGQVFSHRKRRRTILPCHWNVLDPISASLSTLHLPLPTLTSELTHDEWHWHELDKDKRGNMSAVTEEKDTTSVVATMDADRRGSMVAVTEEEDSPPVGVTGTDSNPSYTSTYTCPTSTYTPK